MTEAKIPARVQKIVNAVRSGQRLCKSFRYKESGEKETNFYFEPSGKHCGPKSAEAAIELGLVTPLCDGLFGPETSQQFTLSHQPAPRSSAAQPS